jgi:hypothetical protein
LAVQQNYFCKLIKIVLKSRIFSQNLKLSDNFNLFVIKKILINTARTYHLLIIIALPIFFLGTMVQHSIDLDTWFPVEQITNAGGSASEVLEDRSSEDDIHSNLSHYLLPGNRPIETIHLLFSAIISVQSVPTPPPDHI